MSYLNDNTFLKALDSSKIRTQLVKITILDFRTEKPLNEITGTISSGSISVNSSSSIRRTLNLSMYTNNTTKNIENLENEISLNKKIRVEIGYKNPLKAYLHYGEVIWFPCGVYIINSASINIGTTGATITISAKDKMAQLNGEAGGTIAATTIFHERYETLPSGEVLISHPTIYQIIQEAVHHLGGEPLYNIIISDLDTEIRMPKKYIGSQKIYFNEGYSSFSYEKNSSYNQEIKYQDIMGYTMVDFIHPGELIFQGGSTVEALLKKICETLGNFEFFYDLDGRFIFQEIKNYLNTTTDLKQLQAKDYLRFYNTPIYTSSFDDKETVVSINRSPKYENLKNDFIVWGKRTLPSGATRDIHYRLAIDKKPELYYARQYMYYNNISKDYRFYFNQNEAGANEELCGIPCDEWREELYRQAIAGLGETPYDAELLAEWRNLYDTIKNEWVETKGWNPDVEQHPESINFWLDFIGGNSQIEQYSVNEIGRRTKVLNDNNVKVVFNKEVPDIIFVKTREELEDCLNKGLKAFLLQDNLASFIVDGGQALSCYEKIREMLYQNLTYNTTITITCLPRYYLEPNTIISVEDASSGITGNFLIKSFTLPLVYNGTMNITASEVLSRV